MVAEGCNTMTTEAECTTSAEGRLGAAYSASPCAWCCGHPCTSSHHANLCEPRDWLLAQPNYIGHSKDGDGYNTCEECDQLSSAHSIEDAVTDTAANCSVTVYQHGIGDGWAAEFGVGDYPLVEFLARGAVDNDASSLVVSGDSSCVVTIYGAQLYPQKPHLYHKILSVRCA